MPVSLVERGGEGHLSVTGGRWSATAANYESQTAAVVHSMCTEINRGLLTGISDGCDGKVHMRTCIPGVDQASQRVSVLTASTVFGCDPAIEYWLTVRQTSTRPSMSSCRLVNL